MGDLLGDGLLSAPSHRGGEHDLTQAARKNGLESGGDQGDQERPVSPGRTGPGGGGGGGCTLQLPVPYLSSSEVQSGSFSTGGFGQVSEPKM